MRLRILAVATVLQLAMTGCSGDDATGGAHGKVVKLAMDEEVRAEITSSSPINYNDGSRYQLYSIKLGKDQAVGFELKGAFYGNLTVLQDGRWMASASSHENEDSSTTTLLFKSEQAGRYVVAVSGSGARAFGPYQLRANEIEIYKGGELKQGESIRDFLLKSGQEYVFKVAEAGLYKVEMSSNTIDSVIELQGNGVSAIDDDSGGGADALLTRYLEPGDYTLRAQVAGGERRGDFALSVQRMQLQGSLVNRDGTELIFGEEQYGVLDENSKRRFTLNLDNRTELVIDAGSDSGDMMLEIIGNGVVESDDDSGNGMDARLMQTLAPGRYEVVVTDLAGRAGELFRVRTTLTEVVAGPAGSRRSDTAEPAACAAKPAACAAEAAACAAKPAVCAAEDAACAAEVAACAAVEDATPLSKNRR